MGRWVIRHHEIHDYKTGEHLINRDKGFIYIANELYEEMEEIKRLLKVILDDDY